MKYVTLSLHDPEFKTYINGVLPNNQIAVAVSSLNIGGQREQVTFEIKPKPTFTLSERLTQITQMARVNSWLIVLVPLLVLISYRELDVMNWHPDLAILILLGSLFAFVGLSWLSDVLDYRSGWDRLLKKSTSPLALGWVSTKKLMVLGFLFIFLASLSGLVLLFSLGFEFALLLALAAFLTWAWAYKPLELKYRILGEWVVFLLLGPGLLVGISMGISLGFAWEEVGLGVCFGLLATFLYLVKSFQNLMSDDKARFSTTLVRLGFDRGKVYLWTLFALSQLSVAAYQGYFHGPEWGFIFLVFGLIGSGVLWFFSRQMNSPLGQGFEQYSKVARSFIHLIYSLWVLQATWYFVMSEF